MKVAVLGLGSIGFRHARNLIALGHEVYGFDPDTQRRAALEGAGGRALPSRGAALAGTVAAVVATPNPCHPGDLEEALEAGCHVFVEKPLAPSVDGIAALLDRAEAAGRVVFAGLNLRFHPAVAAAASLIAEGALGRPLWARLVAASYLPDWRPGRDHRQGYAADAATGGVMFDVIHEFDLAHHLLGPAETVAASARATGEVGIAADDVADVFLRHAGGVVSALHLDYVTRPPLRVTEIAGSGGFLRLDVKARRLDLWAPDGRLALTRDYGGSYDDDYRDEIAAFVACARDGARPRCGGREALAVLGQVITARRLAGLPQP